MLCRTFSAVDRQQPQRRSWRSYVSRAIADYVHNRSGQHVYDDDVLQAINDASLDKGLPLLCCNRLLFRFRHTPARASYSSGAA
jgi:hypothetical protein